MNFFFFSSRRRHTRLQGDWSSDVCSSDLAVRVADQDDGLRLAGQHALRRSHVIGKRCRGVLHDADGIAVLLEDLIDLVPTGTVHETTMYENYRNKNFCSASHLKPPSEVEWVLPLEFCGDVTTAVFQIAALCRVNRHGRPSSACRARRLQACSTLARLVARSRADSGFLRTSSAPASRACRATASPT